MALDGELTLGPFTLGPAGLTAAGKPPVEEYAPPLLFALWAQSASPWWIGDLLNLGDAKFGEHFSQVCDGQISGEQLQRYESVARRVPRENRRPGLSWSAHAAVARLPHKAQREMLARAEKFGWTSADLNKKVRAEVARRRAAGESVPPEPTSKDAPTSFLDVESLDADARDAKPDAKNGEAADA